MKNPAIKKIEAELGYNLDTMFRGIDVFDKETEELVAEIPLKPIPLTTLQQIFKAELTNPLLGGYDLTENMLELLRPYFLNSEVKINCSKYDYQFESCAPN